MTSPAQVEFDHGPLTRGQRRIALTAIGGYFVDGYDLLVLSGALLAIVPHFSLNPGTVGLLTAAAFVGMALGSAVAGPLTDRFGRRLIFFTSMIIFVVASLGFLIAGEVWQLIALRFLIGVAIGADMPASAALITEFIPARRRGTFTALGGVAWMLGSLTAITVTVVLFSLAGLDSWRWVMATGAVSACVLIFLRHKTPESPYWLRAHGREEDALTAWRYARGEHAAESWSAQAAAARQTGREPGAIRMLLRRPLAITLFCLCFYWGCNNLYGSAILLYQPTLIKRIITPSTFTALAFTAVILLIAALLGLVVCLWVIETIGRRFVALVGTSIVVVAALVIWLGFTSNTVVLIAFALAIAVINGGTSLAFYAWAPETFPTAVRGRAIGIINMIGKSGSVIGTATLPTMFERLGGASFGVIAAIAAANVVITFLLAPETKGKTLRDIEERR